jgi:hypothetical protein
LVVEHQERGNFVHQVDSISLDGAWGSKSRNASMPRFDRWLRKVPIMALDRSVESTARSMKPQLFVALQRSNGKHRGTEITEGWKPRVVLASDSSKARTLCPLCLRVTNRSRHRKKGKHLGTESTE